MNLSIDTQPKSGEGPRKFMFDKSFDQIVNPRPQERPAITLRPEQLEQIKKEAYEAGYTAGRKATGEEDVLRQTSILTRIGGELTNLLQSMQLLHAQHEKQLRSVIYSIVRKVLPTFIAKNGLEEITSMISQTMSEMGREPRLVVRVNEAQFDFVSTKVNDIATQKAYPGKVVVLADAEILSGDCRIEWADGGIERKATEAIKAVETMVAPEGVPAEAETAVAPVPATTAEAPVAEAAPAQETPPNTPKE